MWIDRLPTVFFEDRSGDLDARGLRFHPILFDSLFLLSVRVGQNGIKPPAVPSLWNPVEDGRVLRIFPSAGWLSIYSSFNVKPLPDPKNINNAACSRSSLALVYGLCGSSRLAY
jgi:hypothetical protein